MAERDTMQQLIELFRATAAAHHEAFAAMDGEDAEWPLWYAERLQAPLSALLGTALTRSEVVWALVAAERERKAEGEAEWAAFYADFFDDTFER